MGGGSKRDNENFSEIHFESKIKSRRLHQNRLGCIKILFQTSSCNFWAQFSAQDSLEDVYEYVKSTQSIREPFLLLQAPVPGDKNKIILGKKCNTLQDAGISSGRVVVVFFKKN